MVIRSRARGLAAGAFLLTSLAVRAQATEPATYVDVGAAVAIVPRYPGAERTRTVAFPAIDTQWRGRLYVHGLDAGVHVVDHRPWQVSVALSGDLTERRRSDDVRLRGLPDVDGTVRLKGSASFGYGLATIAASLATGLGGRAGDRVGTLDATLSIPFFAPWFAAVGIGSTWTSDRLAGRYFSVVPIAGGAVLPAFIARGGRTDSHATLVVSRPLSARWNASVVVNASRLEGDPARSPITLDRTQRVVLASVTYRLRPR